MLPFAISCASVWLIAGFLGGLRPKKSSVYLFIPLFMIVGGLGYFGGLFLAFSMVQGSGSPQLQDAGSGGVTAILVATFVGAYTVNSRVKDHQRNEEIRLKIAAGRAEDDRLAEEQERIAAGDDPRFDNKGSAATAIKYRPDVARTWALVNSLGPHWADAFLETLQVSPQAAPIDIISPLSAYFKEVYPFDGDQMERAYATLTPYGASAQREFRSAIYLLGETASPSHVASGIIAGRTAPHIS
jgi:hypothetical protein